MAGDSRHVRERSFHDDWAQATPLEAVDVTASFEHPAAVENAFILQWLGNISGLRILDVGAGLGEASVYFGLQGAVVTASDISPGMLERCVQLASRHDVRVSPLLLTPGDYDFGEARFDVVYGANVLHHVAEIGACLDGIHRSLVPGGRCVFVDPLKYNPVIWVYRWLARTVRTIDERPVGFDVLRLMRERFIDVGHREFWLLSQALFLKYFLVDRLHPGRVRYWKHILRDEPARLAWWWAPLRSADSQLLRIPGLNRLAWNTVYWGRKPPAARGDGV